MRENRQSGNRVPCPVCDTETIVTWESIDGAGDLSDEVVEDLSDEDAGDLSDEDEGDLLDEDEGSLSDGNDEVEYARGFRPFRFEGPGRQDRSNTQGGTYEPDYNEYVFSDTEDDKLSIDESWQAGTETRPSRSSRETRTTEQTREQNYRDFAFINSEEEAEDSSEEYMTGARPLSTSPW
jgi:hypothetical protein